ncbi:hypothetical protein MNBD_GAMMA08-19 [hydrothermal vent metagenome]|uniref:Uncharacterized protein n=1 Tax=hydrothermal vent metagenome TaxID=652676 RepID=A0A3B0XGI2_9ZZZZ
MVEFLVEKRGRAIEKIKRAAYFIEYVAEEGSVNKEMDDLALNAAMKSMSLKHRSIFAKKTNVIDASFYFEEKSLNKKLKWEPSEDILEALYHEVFGK